MEYALQTRELTRRYGRFMALNGLTMNVPKGAIYGFVGRNGAGKTTLIRLICGLQAPTSGEYILNGVSCRDQAIHLARRRMGAVVEAPAIYLDMTAKDNLRMQCRILGLESEGGAEDGIEALLKLVGLESAGRKKAKHFSLGMKQRLGIAVALCGDPDFLVLDEPVNGLDPQGIMELRELIRRLNRERGITFLISSHLLDELSRLATHYGFIEQGRIVREMSAQELDAACRKCMRIETDNMAALVRTLDRLGAEYRLVSETEADVYTKLSISRLAIALADEGGEILSAQKREESLESYFVSLVGR